MGLGKVGGFAAATATNALIPVVVLPALTSSLGERGWASFAVAQSLGAGGAVLVELGWGLNGPQRVARLGDPGRARAYAVATAAKSVVVVPVALAAAAACWLIVGPDPGMALVAAATTTVGLSPGWFYIGAGSPWRLVVLDALPRLCFALLGAFFISRGSDVWVYAVALLAGSIAAVLIGFRKAGASGRFVLRFGLHRVRRAIRAQVLPMTGRLASSVYIALPVTLIALVSPAAVAEFAAAERVQRLLLAGTALVPNILQNWVGRPADSGLRNRRARRSFWIGLALGLVTVACYVPLFPYVSAVLLSGVVDVGFPVVAISALVVLLTSVSRVTGGVWLVSTRQLGAIARSSYLGLVVGITGITGLGFLHGAAGGMAGEALAEASVLTYQANSLRFSRRARAARITSAG